MKIALVSFKVGMALAIVCITACAMAKKFHKKVVINTSAPDFSLVSDAGTVVSLSSYKGKKVALYFYPRDYTPGCTAQACSLRDGFKDLEKAGISIVGISSGNPQMHASFKKKYSLPFPLLSDEDFSVARLYGLKKSWFHHPRVTFLIDEQGKIVAILHDIDVQHHAQQIIDAFGGNSY